MAVIAQKLSDKTYLVTPQRWSDGDECWFFSKDAKEAHEFKDRAEAKATIRRISQKFTVADFTFRKV
jgi:hypothetical protein